MSGSIAPVSQQQFLDDNGQPLAGGKFYSWITGTSTPLTIWQDAGLSVAHTNPIIMNAGGRVPGTGAMYLSQAIYKTRLTDASDVGIGPANGYTDPVASTGLSNTSIGSVLFVFGGEESSPITATSIPSGATYDKCHADTAWFSIDSAALIGTYALQAQMKSIGGITTSLYLVNLTDGSPNAPIATVTSVSATGDRQQTGPITFASAGAAKTYGIKSSVSSGVGFGWLVQLIRLS